MALNDAAVRVAVTGRVFAALVGTPGPTDVATPLPAPWREVGHVDADALTEALEVAKTVIPSWQRRTGVRTLVESVNWTWKFKAMETSPLILELFYGGATTTVPSPGLARTAIPAVLGSTERAWVVEIVDGPVITRHYIPRGDVTERGEVPHKGTEATVYELTVAVLGTSLDDLGIRYTNDPTFLSAAAALADAGTDAQDVPTRKGAGHGRAA